MYAALLEMIKKERKNKRWRRFHTVVGKKCEKVVLSVKLPVTDEEDRRTSRECTTQQTIFDAASLVLTDRFSGVFSLPCYRGRLFNNLRFMGASECAQQVLYGTYVFPKEMDPATKMLLSECSKLCLPMSREEVSMYVTDEDYHYQYY